MIVNDIGLTKDSYSNIYTADGSEIGTIYDREGHVIYYMYRDTIGDGSRVFISYGAPIKDYKIYGETIQNGTPTPDMPVDVVGCGVRTGNLFDKSTITTNAFDTLNGTQANSNYYCSDFIPITATTYYFQNVTGSSVQNSVVIYDMNKQSLRYASITGSFKVSGALTFIEGDAYIRINCYRTTDVDTVMLNTGSTALPYAPYGYKLPLTCGGTEYPIYLGAVPTTRRIKKLVFDGTENWARTSNTVFYLSSITDYMHSNYTCWCTHFIPFPNQAGVADVPNDRICFGSGTLNRLFLNYASFAIASDLKTYLQQQYAAGTPVTVWYVLAEPETGIVNEPLHRIGDYADTISMAQAGVTIPTLSGTNTLTVDTPVKPSEIDLTGRLKTSGYGQLLDKNLTAINDSTGTPIFIR